jgi:hypothetical protein
MTFHIREVTGAESYNLILGENQETLSPIYRETMHRVMTNSTLTWIGCDDDVAFCTWGLTAPTLLSDRAYLWLYTTRHFKDHIFQFIRHSQRVTEDMLHYYPIIVGHGHTNDQKSLRWLSWCGAKFGTPQGDYIPFEIRADQWQRQPALSA